MSLIQIENLTFAYEGSYDNVFENVNLRIDTDWKLGFIGRNGRGKTTFLRLLCGAYEHGGNIAAPVRFEYFPYEVADPRRHTIDVVSELADFADWELRRELSMLEVSEDVLLRPFETLSNGERTKLLLAALFLKENSFLLIDEPTNHLDMAARALVSAYLKTKKGFILVSHDRAFLDDCVDHILVIHRTGMEIQRGNFSSWQRNKERQDSFELAENEKLKKDIQRLSASAKRSADWSNNVEKTKYATKNAGLRPDRGYIGHKAAKMMKRSKSVVKRQQVAIEEKSKLLKDLESGESLKMAPLTYHAKLMVSLSDVSVFYGEKEACRSIVFQIERGDRLALCGKNGTGKSSLLRLIAGENVAYTGEFYRGSRLIISYVPQDTAFLSGSLADYAPRCGIEESLFKAVLRKLDFSRVQFEKDIRDFSAGQKKKVLIARSLCEKAHLYLWDEPMNFIDVISRMQIEELLLRFKPAILFVEHDRAFCEHVATGKIFLN